MTEQSAVDTIEALKKEHASLYSTLVEDQLSEKKCLETGKEHDEFVAKVNILLDKLELVTPRIRLLDDFKWVINTSSQWQAFSSLLDLDRRIKIPEPEELWAPTHRLSKKDIDQWLVSQQIHICRFRHLEEFVWRLRNVTVEKVDRDKAKVYLAKDILSGELDFVEKVPPAAYEYLEEVWFRDVIQLEAYLIWEHRGAELDRPPELTRGDYLDAWEKV